MLISRPKRAYAQMGKCNCPNGQMQLPKWANIAAQTGKCSCPNGQMQLPKWANVYIKKKIQQRKYSRKIQQEDTAGRYNLQQRSKRSLRLTQNVIRLPDEMPDDLCYNANQVLDGRLHPPATLFAP